jgi:hypothetical protein
MLLALSVLAVIAFAVIAVIGGAAQWLRSRLGGRERPPRDVHPGEMRVYFRGEQGDGS